MELVRDEGTVGLQMKGMTMNRLMVSSSAGTGFVQQDSEFPET